MQILPFKNLRKKNEITSNHDLQTYFNMKLIPMLKKHNKRLMGWEEIMTKDMSKDAIIHAWRGGNEGVTQVERLLQPQRMATIQFCLMGIILI
jgi:hexosaminidase